MQVRVLNLNTYPYKENFRDKLIEIPAARHFKEIEGAGEVMMDEDEALYFLQTYTFPAKDSQGRPDPKAFKMLKIHPDDAKAIANRGTNPIVCHANGQKFDNTQELAKVLGEFTHMLAEKDGEAESESLKAKNRALAKENKQLKSRLDIIEEKLGLRETQDNDQESVSA